MQDPLRHLPGYALRRASAAMMAELAERLAPLGVRQVEASILLVLAANPGISQSALGKLLGIQRANMTPLAARLEQRGLIKRTASDGRSLGLALSQQGATLAARVREQVDLHERVVTERIPPEHRPHLIPALLALWSDEQSNKNT
ncbi:MAG: MarR family winged helix-turn-helix transcriptional regulator [Novosphingobium sp.]